MSDDVGRLWLDKAYGYAEDVLAGRIPTCRYVRLSVERFDRDLSTGYKRGLHFSEQAAAEYFRFVGRYCRHYQGEWAGKLMEFEPWQCFIEANIHGWMREGEDGRMFRRFRRAYEEVARKNGKSTRLGANGDYYLIGDREEGAQVYVAATKREQTKEIFDAAAAIVDMDPRLARLASTYRGEIRYKRSVLGRLSKDAKRMDGLNVHAALVDEIHAHQDSGVWDVLRSAQGARKQPIMRGITTAGFDKRSFAYQLRAYVIKVLEGVVQDDGLFGMIYTIDDEERWDDEREWVKANPNIGVSVSIDDLREQCAEAREMPSAKVEFLTKRLNVWLHGEVLWMPVEKWRSCTVESMDGLMPWKDLTDCDGLLNAECYGGLDLASTEDLCSLALCFTDGDKRRVFQRSWLPEAALQKRFKKGDKTLQQFVDSGHLVIVPGVVIDQKWIEKDIKLVCERFDVRSIFFDRWNSSQLVTNMLENEVPMVGFGQGFASISAPMKELMRLTLVGDIEHNDPLLAWAISNVVEVKDPAGNIKTDKSKSSEKIDPAQAVIMAVAGAMRPDEPEDKQDFVEL